MIKAEAYVLQKNAQVEIYAVNKNTVWYQGGVITFEEHIAMVRTLHAVKHSYFNIQESHTNDSSMPCPENVFSPVVQLVERLKEK